MSALREGVWTARLHLQASLRTPVAALAVYAVLCALLLPVAGDLALAAAPRAVADLGLLGLRVLGWSVGLALGAAAIGPDLRRGASDLWRVRALGPLGWAAARLLGSAALLPLTLMAALVIWLVAARALGIPLPPGLRPFFAGALAEAATAWVLAAAAGAWLRGFAGPLLAMALVVLGHLRLAWQALPGDLSGAELARTVSRFAPTPPHADLQALLLRGGTVADLDGLLLLGLWGIAAIALTLLRVHVTGWR